MKLCEECSKRLNNLIKNLLLRRHRIDMEIKDIEEEMREAKTLEEAEEPENMPENKENT